MTPHNSKLKERERERERLKEREREGGGERGEREKEREYLMYCKVIAISLHFKECMLLTSYKFHLIVAHL